MESLIKISKFSTQKTADKAVFCLWYNYIMRNTTLLFLVKKNNGKITDICLAMKKRGFGTGYWNGAGGKLEESETVEQAVIRETDEEISVVPEVMEKVAELTFMFPNNPDWNALCHVYLCTHWTGQPTESEEMKPQWFSVDSVPYDAMWSSDAVWLPKSIDLKLLKAQFSFGENNTILEQEVSIVDSL